MRSSARVLVMPVLVLLLASSMTACSQDDSPESSPTAKPTPLSQFDAGGMTIARTDFCDRIPATAVERAVGEVADSEHYGNGESAAITRKVKDVAHEFNCTFTGTSGAVARVWVFKPQVTRARARELVKSARGEQGCRLAPGQGFGKPSTGLSCRSKDGVEASYRGLFVDSWLACSLSDPDATTKDKAILDRAGKWCVQAVTAAATE